ncbi:hypothetical protein HAX54_030732 [Datura stramonium]|uniref:BHLH domain-containing protein n=1 Tax=Datura stramonium TaxID=4076 RepID=A0ABS8VAV3_DATST|nr:hypothetical protein [Datura stramonium]
MSNGWSFEEALISYDDHRNNTTVTTAPQSQTNQTNELLFEGLPRIDDTIDFSSSRHQQYYSKESHEFDVELGAERSLMAKKLNHNASERNRRKKMNFLYSTLRSLLPPPAANQHHQKVLVQISTTQENDFPISEAFGSLEEDHDLILLNASSFKSFGDKIFHSLHFQAKLSS